MNCALINFGFKNPESLKQFCYRYPNLPSSLDSELERVWICHKNEKEIPLFHNISDNQNEDFNKIQKNFKELSNPLLTEFNPSVIFRKIVLHFGNYLTCYLFTKCFVFYNWGMNSYEPIINHLEVEQSIEENVKSRRLKTVKSNRKKFVKNNENFKTDLDSSKPLLSNTVSHSKFKNAIQHSKQYIDLPRNPGDPSQEFFNLNRILYDLKQKPKWPSNHILSSCNSESLLQYIIETPVITKIPDNEIFLNCGKLIKLKELLECFIDNHRKIEKNYGYGRILKGYLKKVKVNSVQKLNPIPRNTVNSFIINTIRRTLPLQLFGCNRLRKKFFSEVLNYINGYKMQTFMWFSLVRHFYKEKLEIPWCREIKNPLIQDLILLKLFKFIVLRYVFVILKNNFYITETGSSCYALRFYRKGEIESASSVCIKNLLAKNQVMRCKKRDFDGFSVERKWIETGIVDELDLNKKRMKFMKSETEFKQPIAKIRFLPKSDFGDEVRIITCLPNKRKIFNKNCEEIERVFEKRLEKRREELRHVKLFLEFLLEKNGIGIRPLPSNSFLENAWRKAQYLKERFGKLHFVKADITDAFGSIDQNLLMKNLENYFGVIESIQLKEIAEWRKLRGRVKKITRQSYSNRPRENCILMNRRELNQPKNQKIKFLNIIEQHTTKQRIEINGKIYKLIKGLAQGSVGKFSPQLCELYYSAMDRESFESLINCKDSILLRGVDDYLFITIDKKKAEEFLETVQSGIKKFNVEFKKNKLKSNLLENIKEITYLGLKFNFESMLVEGNYSKLNKTNLVSRIKLTDKRESFHFDKKNFLYMKSLVLKSLKLERILLDNKYNTVRETRRIVYRACVVQTLRVVSLVKYLHGKSVKNEMNVFRLMGKICGKIVNLTGILPREEVEWLFYSAMLEVVGKNSAGFGNLLIMGKFKLGLCEKSQLKKKFDVLIGIWKNELLEFRKDIEPFYKKEIFY